MEKNHANSPPRITAELTNLWKKNILETDTFSKVYFDFS